MDDLKESLDRVGLDKKSLLHFCWNGPIVFILAVVLSGALVGFFEASMRGYHRMQDPDYWATYYSIEPVSKEFGWDQPIRLTSVLEVKHETDLAWSHTLYCRPFPRGGFDQIDTMVGSSLGMQPIKTHPLTWQWRGNVPKITTECYIDFVLTYTDPLTGVQKRQYIQGGDRPFMVNVR